jgi:hypothetical protein
MGDGYESMDMFFPPSSHPPSSNSVTRLCVTIILHLGRNAYLVRAPALKPPGDAD